MCWGSGPAWECHGTVPASAPESGFSRIWPPAPDLWHPRAVAQQIIDNEARAQQLARAIASDIQLYNKAKIEQGLKDDNFFELLGEEITEGRDLFRSRVTPELFRRNYFDRAIVDRVIKTMANLESEIW